MHRCEEELLFLEGDLRRLKEVVMRRFVERHSICVELRNASSESKDDGDTYMDMTTLGEDAVVGGSPEDINSVHVGEGDEDESESGEDEDESEKWERDEHKLAMYSVASHQFNALLGRLDTLSVSWEEICQRYPIMKFNESTNNPENHIFSASESDSDSLCHCLYHA